MDNSVNDYEMAADNTENAVGGMALPSPSKETDEIIAASRREAVCPRIRLS